MEFHQLKYFVAAAEELSMSRAAERVHVSQPALSRQIRLLEEEMGLQLFDSDTALITLTAAVLLGAGFVQLAVPALLLRRHGCLPMPRLPGRGDPARQVFANMVPIVIGSSIRSSGRPSALR